MAPNQSKMAKSDSPPSSSSLVVTAPDVEIRVHTDHDCSSYTSVLAHQHMLASSSPVLQARCLQAAKSGCRTVLDISDSSLHIVSTYLHFIYNDPDQSLGSLDMATLLDLSHFAQEYKVYHLQMEILKQLRNYKICHKNVIQLAQLVGEYKHAAEDACQVLKQSLLTFITVNLKSAEEISTLILAHLTSSGTVTLGMSVWDMLKDVAAGARKTVRFSDLVQKQTYTVGSAVLPNTAKNRKKAEKKRRASEKRNSESDASSVEEKYLHSQRTILDKTPEGPYDDANNDSGIASSFEESVCLHFDEAMLMEDGEDNNPFTSCSEFIFNMEF